MTVRVTTLKGAGAGDYYLEGGGLPGYYVDVDEPRGVWFGRGTEWLGLDGEVDDEHYTQLAVSYRADDGIVDVMESWRFALDDDTGEHVVSNFEIFEPSANHEQSHATIAGYFGHIERGDWDAVAAMLDDGAVNFEERSDYQELDPIDFTREQVIAALEAWCTGCDTEMPEADELAFTGSYGIDRGDRFIYAVIFEGRYSIMGLPFPTDEN